MSWPGLKRAGLISIFVLFTIGGAAMAIIDNGGNRFIGLGTVLFFGGGGATWWFMNRPRSAQASGLQIGRVPVAGGYEPAFVARSDRRALIVAGLGGMAMGAGALVFALPAIGSRMSDIERGLMAAGGVFFVGVGLFALYRTGKRPHLALTRRGIHAIGPAGWFVPWDAIVGVGELSVYDNPFLAIRVADPGLVSMGGLQRFIQPFERSMMGSDLSFPVRTLRVDPAELGVAIGRYLEHPDQRARIGRADELELMRGTARPDPEPVLAPIAETRRRPSFGRALAIGSLFVVGGLLALVCLAALFDDSRTGSPVGRLIGIALVGALAVAQIAAAILLVRKHAAGRWIGIGSVVGLLALALIGFVRSEPDERGIGIAISSILAAQLLVIAIGARVTDPADERSSAVRPT